ncbi:MAG: 50S ribosomal protein L25/general stress protein Ctc [Bacteroidota bacterium]
MKTVEVIGYKRANLGKPESKRLREEGYVPCVLYGGKEQVHFYAPNILFRELVYTAEAHFVELNIEGEKTRAIIQDVQFHPVSEAILHADFLQLFPNKIIKMDVPIHLEGRGKAPGVQQGGKFVHKLRKLTIKALPDNMPEHIDLDVSKLGLGKSVKVSAITPDNFEIINSPIITVATVEVPRALKSAAEEAEEEAEAMEAAGAAAEGGESEAAAEGGES